LLGVLSLALRRGLRDEQPQTATGQDDSGTDARTASVPESGGVGSDDPFGRCR